MPTPLMKSFAKETHKKPKTVEKIWKKAERIVKKDYDIDDKNSRYYPLVVGTLKHLLGIEKIEEDDAVASCETPMTTSNIGDYTFANKIGAPAARVITSEPLIVNTSIDKKNKKKKIKTNKEYDKLVRSIVKNVNNEGLTLDEAISSMIEYYCEGNSDNPVDDSLDALSRFFGLAPSIFDDLN